MGVKLEQIPEMPDKSTQKCDPSQTREVDWSLFSWLHRISPLHTSNFFFFSSSSRTRAKYIRRRDTLQLLSTRFLVFCCCFLYSSAPSTPSLSLSQNKRFPGPSRTHRRIAVNRQAINVIRACHFWRRAWSDRESLSRRVSTYLFSVRSRLVDKMKRRRDMGEQHRESRLPTLYWSANSISLPFCIGRGHLCLVLPP
jgi:hypothetical protein